VAKDIKPIFLWAKEKGDANIYDRIIMKVLPQLLQENIQLTSDLVEESNEILVSDDLYSLVLNKTEQLVGVKYV
jgi:hypothetical protein